MSVNDQYLDPDPFGGPGGYGSTSAPGTAPPAPESGGGATVGTVTVTPPYGSSQVPWPSVNVQQGDTCGSAADAPVPPSGDPMTGLSLEQVTSTGAGTGGWHGINPNSMSRPGR